MPLFSWELIVDTSWGLIFRNLFSNMCIILLLSFVYLQARWKWVERRARKNRYMIDGVAGGILGIILMYYSIRINSYIILDLRYAVIVLVMLFGGMRAAAISSSIIILARLTLGIGFSAYAGIPIVATMLIGFALMNKMKVLQKVGIVWKGLFLIIYSNIAFSIVLCIAMKDPVLLTKMLTVYWTLSTFCALISIVFVLYVRRSHDLLVKYESEATTDFLTGLNNVRQFDIIWNHTMQRALSRKESLSLLAIDVDFFKEVNDTYGHATGDLVLAEIGKLLKKHSRPFDIVSRNGGEEFSIIMPDCTNMQAIRTGEQIRKVVESHLFPIDNGSEIRITISVGTASYPETVLDPESLLRQADECLYQAKRAGRNRVWNPPILEKEGSNTEKD
ncbi:diguanylate cyclase [Aciduricibacillus chroicocephali]|uniref:Diguanylate cyclase n=1 Tax=Aciduricibacillus chroicocephali TaxID=3054939 RepID=A0ABY9KUP4_9BACI|nr:diguanylate cyclase [Bacillaceae bacterium 44XB]